MKKENFLIAVAGKFTFTSFITSLFTDCVVLSKVQLGHAQNRVIQGIGSFLYFFNLTIALFLVVHLFLN